MRTEEPQFVPRPWPERPPERSPLTGRRVLVVDADLAAGRRLAAELCRVGCASQSVEPGPRLEPVLAGTLWEAVVADAAALDPGVRALLRTRAAGATLLVVAGAVEAALREELARDAFAMHARPVEPRELLVSLGRALEQRTLEEENRRLRESLAGRFALESFVTHDARMRRVLETVEAVADTRATVLLLGESGTGKTRLARAIHEHGSRRAGPFIVVNCGALPAGLLESELFGHVRGAFTGALRDKPGKFELADGGSIFLDEVNSASLDLQVKLLRVLQERRFERVGDGRTREVDVRVLAASNADIEAEIEAGRFREDLYWRLHVVALELPPLRERPRDLAHLAEHFRARFAAEYGRPIARLHPEALACIVAYDWPGNVRQLENVIERAVLLAAGPELLPRDLGAELQPAALPAAPAAHDLAGTLAAGLRNLKALPPLKEALEGPEREIIRRALELNGGNRQATARMLQVNRATLFNKMKKHGLMELSFERS